MLHRQKIVSILAVFALLLGNAAGWMHVHIHAGGPCGCAETQATCLDGDQHSGLHSSSQCDSTCSDSPLRARWMAKRAAAESAKCCDWETVDTLGKHFPTPHESDDCAICQHFLTCRHQTVGMIAPAIISLGEPTESVSVDRPIIRSHFQDFVHFLRGPPVA